MRNKKKVSYLLIFFIGMIVFYLFPVGVSAPVFASDTMLMFVGEDLEVISLASRREEAAWKAPAIAHVITREEINHSGDATIADLLEKSAGFYINEREQGSIPYLRGIPDSTLFLYDTVPIGSGANKSFHSIDNEISLASIKRIEIIRGAGSVLWGPDAFAGVVNVVPFTGKDFQGVETGVGMSSLEDSRLAFFKYGREKGPWSSFVSVSAKSAKEDDNPFNVVRFWNDGETPVNSNERYGNKTADDSYYYELYSNLSFDDWLIFSARVADTSRAYSIGRKSSFAGSSDKYSWEEKRSNPTQTFKIEASRSMGLDSGLRFTGYYTNYDVCHTIIDKDFKQSERSIYGELIYDQSLFTGDGLLTTGVSWRETNFSHIFVWKSFMPDYLVMDNVDFLPSFEKENYDNRLGSVFGQYRHRFSDLELWAGIRNDDHDRFEDKVSYNVGGAWNFSSDFMFKAIYGTAYRTPFARQLEEKIDGDLRLERINSTNVQLSWMPDREKKLSLTFFRNEIENHVVDERYQGYGVSTPNSQTIDGVEFEWDLRITEDLCFSGNITVLDNSGPDETYFYTRYEYKDGYEYGADKTLNYNYDTGADTMINLAVNWRITDNLTLAPQFRYFSKVQLHYLEEVSALEPLETTTIECPQVWLMDLHLKIKDIFPFDVDLFVENLFDEKYKTPGVYSEIQGNSFNAGILIKMTW